MQFQLLDIYHDEVMYRTQKTTTQLCVDTALHFKISDAPQYPFVNQPFDLHISLVDDTGRLKVDREVPMTIKVFFEDMEECSRQVLDIDRLTPCKIHINGKAIIRVKLNTLSATFGDRRYIIVATPLIEEDSLITCATSTPMTCVKYKLELDNIEEIPSLWFKDQGGKLKSIDLQVKLVGPNGVTVQGKMVPIRLELRYNNGDIVPRQDILEATRDSRMLIGDVGQTLLRTRVNEVSMRHQGKLFCIYVHPDTRRDPLSCDISPASTPGIEIRSKITTSKNKRTLEEVSTSSSPMSLPYTSSPPDPFVQGRTHLTPGIQHMPALSMPPRVTGRASTASYEGEGGMGGRSTVCDLLTRGQHHPHSAPHALTHPNAFSFEASQAAPVTASAATADSLLPHTHRTVPVCDPTADPPDIYAWAEMVTQHLDSLRWHQIGYEKLQEGRGGYTTRPLYEMSNPNDCIDDLIRKYAAIAQHGVMGGGRESTLDETSCDEEDYGHNTFRRRIGSINTYEGDVAEDVLEREGGDVDSISAQGHMDEGEEHDVNVLPEGLKLGKGLSRDNSLYLAVGDIWQ